MCNKKYYAHSGKNEDRSDWQELKVHLKETAELCHKFADKFKQGELGRIAGLLHDLGKYSKKFQHKIITQNKSIKVDHATAGAKEAVLLHDFIGEYILSYCVAGHHCGLSDKNDLDSRLKKEIEDYSTYKNEELNLNANFGSVFSNITSREELPFAASFLTRMIYSCLVDADWLNSAGEKPGSVKPADLQGELAKYIEEITQKDPEKPINIKRAEILAQCRKMAQGEKSLYSLTVPTGGGKTLSSMAFAMEHAIKHNMDRIIYAIPYTSIIEQNAQVFRGIFGEGNVLEHHSNYIFEEDEKDDEDSQELAEKLKKASENWDAPIIATTNVQFFESLFASNKKRCRKLHNIANSVIILDEAQMIPPEYLIPCVNAIAELVKRYGCTVVLCTATQPALDKYFKDLNIEITDIIPEPDRKKFADFFDKRVEVKSIKDRMSDNKLVEQVSAHNQALVIVNTKGHALALYEKLKEELKKQNDESAVYHLSTYMCPAHRKAVLAEIKDRIKPENNLPTKVVSTQLIEAGVDIDFPHVYRAVAGADSIAQAAGRCNREGKLEKGFVWVFEPAEVNRIPKGHLRQTADVGKQSMDAYPNSILSIDAIKHYFLNLFFYKGEQELDKKNVMNDFKMTNRGNLTFDFREAAGKFRFIEEKTLPVIVPCDEKSKELIEKLRFAEFPKKYLRALQPYTVSLYEQDYMALISKGAVEKINDVATILMNPDGNYNNQTGIVINKESEALFV